MNGKVVKNLRRNVKPVTRDISSCRKLILILIAMALIVPRLLFSQDTDSLIYAESEATSLKYLKSAALLEQESRANKAFIKAYKIDLSTSKEAIVLVKTRIKDDSNIEEGNDVANVDMGTVVKIYRYCKKYRSYAVKHKNKWGFLPETVLQEL